MPSGASEAAVQTPTSPDVPPASPLPPQAAAEGAPLTLEARALACERGERLLFADLDLRLASGAMLQVEGHNGSGKTSLLRILCGLAQPLEGRVLWCGKDIRRHRHDYLNHVAYLGHANGIKGELTPLENLRIAQGLGHPDPQVSATEALERVGLADFDDAPCHTLSAGQRRRVALAHLLAVRTPLWVLDEPFTSLDRRGVAMVEGLLRGHLDRGGMAVVTTHHPMDLGGHPVTLLNLSAGEVPAEVDAAGVQA
jgi:heme exporter protein A